MTITGIERCPSAYPHGVGFAQTDFWITWGQRIAPTEGAAAERHLMPEVLAKR
jgi:hypothetical protein